MFNVNEKIVDDLDDDIGLILKKICELPTFTKEKKRLHQLLMEALKGKGYMQFVGHPRSYHLSRIGESCLYDVPHNRRGHLKSFRNQRIRLVCVSSGRFDRYLMAKTII